MIRLPPPWLSFTRVSVIVSLLCLMAGVIWLNPKPDASGFEREAVVMENWIPHSFGGWRLDDTVNVGPLSLIAAAESETVYVQTLERIFVDDDGRRIMLSLAYGDRQEGDLQAHRPEFCYKAQGFQLSALHDIELATVQGVIPLRRMEARRPGRSEPVSYWLTIGDRPALPGFHRKLAQLRHGLTGKTPDGLLIRVSSLDENPEQAYALHNEFIMTLIESLPPDLRRRLAGAPRSASPNLDA